MKITQIEENVFLIDGISFNHNEINYSKGWLEKAYDILEKQKLAVLNTEYMLEAAKNKLVIAEDNYNKLKELPYDIEIDNMPDEVTLVANLGSDEVPISVQITIPKTHVKIVLERNSQFAIQ
jgi:hypothetical protein